MTDESESATRSKIVIDLDNQPLSAVIKECERVYLGHVLSMTNGNKAKAAILAGLSLPTLRAKLGGYTVITEISLK